MEKSNVILPASTKLAKGIDGLDEVARRSENIYEIYDYWERLDRRFAIKKNVYQVVLNNHISCKNDLKPTLSSIKN